MILAALTIVGGGAAFWAGRLSTADSSQALRWLCWLVFISVAMLCFFWVGVVWRRHNWTIENIRLQLQQFEEADEIGMIMVDIKDELAGLVNSINRYLTTIKFRSEKERLGQKELQLQASVAETERRQVEAVIFSISEAVLVTDFRFEAEISQGFSDRAVVQVVTKAVGMDHRRG